MADLNPTSIISTPTEIQLHNETSLYVNGSNENGNHLNVSVILLKCSDLQYN